jgi:signal transduction histidine kinase/ActR/RegA family two-component response regulator
MQQSKYVPISKELRNLVISTLSILLLFGLLCIFIVQIFSYQNSSESELKSLARLIGTNSRASIAFKDIDAANIRVNEAGLVKDSIIEVAILNSDYSVLSRFNRQTNNIAAWYISDFFGFVEVIEPVELDKETIGFVKLKADFSPLIFQSIRTTAFVAIVLLVGIFLSQIISRRLHRRISDPLVMLADRFNAMQTGVDLQTLDLPEKASLEVRDLFRGFNSLVQRLSQQAIKLASERDRAEEASKAKSQFLTNMSHELRTPLNGIIGMTGLTLESQLDEDQRECLETSLESSYALLGLVEDILTFSALEASKIEIKPSAFNLRKLVDSIVRLLSLRAKEEKVSLLVDIDQSVPELVIADQGRLRQIIINLVQNAIKFSPENSPVQISVSAKSNQEHEVAVICSVTDKGIGISTEQQQLIFERFYQVDSKETRAYGGVGLGLSICSHLVKLMGGDISVVSYPGVGSCFTFSINALAVNEKFSKQLSELSKKAVNQVGWGSDHSLSKIDLDIIKEIKIMVVDDNATSRILVKKLLTRKGINVLEASNGFEAINRYKDFLPHLVLMDYRMPGLDGIDATKQIRNFEKSNNLTKSKIIALTAFTENIQQQNCFDAGMDDYLSKPFDPDKLFLVIETQLTDFLNLKTQII